MTCNIIFNFSLYDTNIYKQNEDYLKLFFICSKDNPIRIYNSEGLITQNYFLKNHLDEIIHPISLKLDQYGMNLFCGAKKKIIKIDLISDQIVKNESIMNETEPISCFDIKNDKNEFYLAGSYSGKIYLLDSKTDKPFTVIEDHHKKGVNSIQFFNNSPLFISGGRRENCLNIWDVRNLSQPLTSIYRVNESNQKTNLCLDADDKYLYVPNSDGTIIIYDMNTFEVVSYFYANETMEAVNSVDLMFNDKMKMLVSSTGTRHFVVDSLNEEVDSYKSSTFRFWNVDPLYM